MEIALEIIESYIKELREKKDQIIFKILTLEDLQRELKNKIND